MVATPRHEQAWRPRVKGSEVEASNSRRNPNALALAFSQASFSDAFGNLGTEVASDPTSQTCAVPVSFLSCSSKLPQATVLPSAESAANGTPALLLPASNGAQWVGSKKGTGTKKGTGGMPQS